ncbi:merR regulatory family protein [Clostridium baratii str. Sullivan]|uniref:MerR regulatory family protein n=1 Tax=Clostridium baratii str. Sullivan TaxID=1415775 RepID=A0A0A7FX95_9CLOT|nr:helix-turn-helix domain-containing protein [Clostridium baratii]AIY84198.1 merR regulatory family protein [Clostridium baratii str. Sullivan]
MKNLYSIGEVSKIKEVTIKALRYYHKMGILIPKYIDKITGYRYYSIDQFIYIDIIKGCRALGTSIVELQEIFKECDTDKLLKFLQLKRYEAEENIRKMQEIIKNIDTLNEVVERSNDISKNDEISIDFFDKRYIVVAPCKEVGDLKELIYYSDLEKIVKEKSIETSVERGIIYNFNSDGDIEPRYVFYGVQENSNIEINDNIKVLPSGQYLTVSYSKENMDKCKRKISNYIKEKNLKVKSLIELDLVNDLFNTESYNCQIQMLIENKF